MRDTLSEMHRLGCNFPSHEQLQSLGARALKTALMGTPWAREFEHIAPRERFNFAKLAEDWASRIENNFLKPRLGERSKEVA
jgi:hypothetical protein